MDPLGGWPWIRSALRVRVGTALLNQWTEGGHHSPEKGKVMLNRRKHYRPIQETTKNANKVRIRSTLALRQFICPHRWGGLEGRNLETG